MPVMALALLAMVYVGPDSVLFRYQLPRHYALSADCRVLSDSALTSLETLEFWGVPRYSKEPLLLRRIQVPGRAGETDSVCLYLPGIWTVYTIAISGIGGRSCPSPMRLVHGEVASVSQIPKPMAEAWFDLSGRKIQKPTIPGVYVHRVASRARKLVVIR